MLVVNLYGGPSAGKSTVRADVFSRLKRLGINCEEVSEAAKRYTWQKRGMSLACQPYLFGKQLHETVVLDGQVDVVITDSPLMLCCIYGRKGGVTYPESFFRSIIDISNQMNTLDVFLRRVHDYNPVGRGQDEKQSDNISNEIVDLLVAEKIDYSVIDGNDQAGELIVEMIMQKLGVQ